MNALQQRVAGLTCWRKEPHIEPLAGGITNNNFRVDHGGERFVVRLGDDIAEHNILRSFELSAARAAHAAGIGPEIVHCEPGALVMREIDGRTLTPEDVRTEHTLQRLVALVAYCHRELPRHHRGPVQMFWVFQVLRDYNAGLRQDGSGWVGELDRLMRTAEELESCIGAIHLVFGHNDLLAANFLDDGSRIWLIDWEYAGFNSPLFDLGGLASNNELEPPWEREVLRLYFGKPPDGTLWRRFQAMKCASLLRETLWSMVSEIHSQVEFDYPAYTRENLARFDAAWTEYSQS